MLLCKFCNKECKNDNSLRNHERLCKCNPNRDTSTIQNALSSAKKLNSCKYCGRMVSLNMLGRHEDSCAENPTNKKECPVCKKLFSKASRTCSYACSNVYFRSGKNNGNYSGNNYRTVAKEHHVMRCVICDEDKIVGVHHYDENHNNNDPKNLIPLCPTHHTYYHSKYRYMVIDKIEEYGRSLG